jgi:hypothetical protein
MYIISGLRKREPMIPGAGPTQINILDPAALDLGQNSIFPQGGIITFDSQPPDLDSAWSWRSSHQNQAGAGSPR